MRVRSGSAGRARSAVGIVSDTAAHCAHLRDARDHSPNTPDGCEECLATGDTWVHLRLCLACGHVGCCDSSKNKHATKHNRSTTHPVIRSFQPGEEWRYCYPDDLFVE